MKVRRHPKSAVLKDWLNGGGSADVDVHVANCHWCAESLERLAEQAEVPEADAEALAEALAAVLEPPEDLAERLERRVAARLSSRETIGVLADLFGAGVEASKLLFTEDLRNGND